MHNHFIVQVSVFFLDINCVFWMNTGTLGDTLLLQHRRFFLKVLWHLRKAGKGCILVLALLVTDWYYLYCQLSNLWVPTSNQLLFDCFTVFPKFYCISCKIMKEWEQSNLYLVWLYHTNLSFWNMVHSISILDLR